MIGEYKQIADILENIYLIEDMLRKQSNADINLIADLQDAMGEINQVVFGCGIINSNKAVEYAGHVLGKKLELEDFLTETVKWRELVLDTLQRRSNLNNNIDREFYTMMDYISMSDLDQLIGYGKETIAEIKCTNENAYNELKKYYTFYINFWGGLDPEHSEYGVIEQRIRALKEHQEDFLWLYNRLGDYRSKKVLNGILHNWLSFDKAILNDIKEHNFSDYFDPDLIECDDNEVFVDLGAFTGDSAKSFLDTYGKYKRIYCYEITRDSIEKCKNQLSDYENIEIRCKGAGSKPEIKYFHKFGVSGSSNMVMDQGEIPVEIVAIDEDITEKITFIKMDIEGAEQEALAGCRRHIKEEHPKMTICTYHNNEDIWKIPRMIDDMDSSYRFYMRYNGKQIGPTEYVLFAL